MYRRYTQTGESGVSMAQIKRSRLKDLLILLLIAALAASLAIGIPARLEKNSLRGNVIRQISKECDDAIASTKAMSPNGRSDSAAQLARIRSNLYAIRAINNLNHTESGEYLISEDRLNTLIDGLSTTVGQVHRINEQNAELIKHSLEMVEFDLQMVKAMREAPQTANYGRSAMSTGGTLGTTSEGFDAKQ